MLSDDDNLGIYDDLDEFQQAEDHKSKELLAWEVKHRNALTEIEDLKARNKALEKKIKTMEVNLQNLLDTAKSEVRRKEMLIGQLRKEKDDICFRRKRGREIEEPAEKEPENKRLKPASSKVDPEVKKNPFKADSKIDAKSVGKRRSRSRSPKSRSKTQEHEPETRRKSRERRRSRSRSPRHLSRQEEHRIRASSWRRRSRSPRSQVSGSKTQIIPSLLGKDTTNGREIGRKPHHEKPKRMRDEVAAPTNPIELCTPKVATTKTQGPTIEFGDLSAAEVYFQGNAAIESNNPTNFIDGNSGAFLRKEGRIPGLNMISEPAVSNRGSAATSQFEDPEINQPPASVPKSAQKDEPQTALISNNNAQIKEHLQVDAIAIEPSKPDIESPMRDTKYEPTGTDDDRDNYIEKPSLNQSTIELMKDHIMVHAEENVDLLVASGAAQGQEDINFSSAGNLSEPKSETCDVGIRIIEDIRLPEVSDIGHISNIVNDLCGGLEGVTKKDEQNNASGKDVDCNEPCDYTEGNVSLSDLKEPTTPSMCSNVLYAQPDSTKFDQNDTDNGVILETALNLLPCTDLAPPPQSAPNESYPKLCLEEDAIEKALGKLHQTSSPDETVVTSTSNRARKVEHICSPTSTRLSHSSVQPEEPATLPEIVNPDDSQSQVSRILELQPPSPSQDITIDETVDDGCIANMDPLLTVTKRCSLGHTDYQFEQRNDEIILRVKRRTRRRCSTPLEVRVPKPPSTGGTAD